MVLLQMSRLTRFNALMLSEVAVGCLADNSKPVACREGGSGLHIVELNCEATLFLLNIIPLLI